MKLTAVFIEVPEGYVAFVEELPGAQHPGGTRWKKPARIFAKPWLWFSKPIATWPSSRWPVQNAVREPFEVDRSMKRLDLIRHLEANGCTLLRDRGEAHGIRQSGGQSNIVGSPRQSRDLNLLIARKSVVILGILEP